MPHDRTLVAIEDIEPVGVGTVPVGVDQGSVAGSPLIVSILLGVHNFGFLAEFVDTISEIIEYAALALTLLGGNEDHTVTCLGTVNGGGSTVLEDLHGFNHRRVKISDAGDLQSIDDIQRVGSACTVGCETTDTDLRILTRSTAG